MDGRVEVISTVQRRRRWSPEDKVAILDEAFRPGGSVASTADRHGVSRALIYLWRRQAREGEIPGVGVREAASTPFVPVRISSVAPEPPRQARTELRRARTPKIRLANGRVLKVDENIDPAALARIVAVLERAGS